MVLTVNCLGVEFTILTIPEYPFRFTSLFELVCENPKPFTLISAPCEEIVFVLSEVINGIIFA